MTDPGVLRSRARGALPPALRRIAVTLFVVSVVFWVSLVPGAGAQLEYQRDAAGAAFLARGLSGHLVHAGWGHLGWNLLGFLVLGAVCERGNRAGFAWAVGQSALAIPIALYFFEPGIGRYCGLSGLVSALFGILATRAIVSHVRSGHRVLALATTAIAVGFAWRLGWTWIRGDFWLLESSGLELTPVPLSHAIGLAIGVLVEVVETFRGPRSGPNRCAPARARVARSSARIQLEESMIMRSSRTLRRASTATIAAVLLVSLPGAARADHAAGPRRGDCASTESFWRDTADACAECAARLRHADPGAHRSAPPVPRPYRSSLPHPYRANPSPPRPSTAHMPAPHRERPRVGARAPGLLPVTAASAARSHETLARTLDPVVDPILRETTEAVGTVAGTAIGVALYPPFKVLEHVLGAPD